MHQTLNLIKHNAKVYSTHKHHDAAKMEHKSTDCRIVYIVKQFGKKFFS